MSLVTALDLCCRWLNGHIWGAPLPALMLATHLFFTVRLRFIQRHLPLGIKLTFKGDFEARGDVSHRSALFIALGATLGTGNIIGVAAALSLGGPGALFWYWITGILGMSTRYAEALLSVKYRSKTRKGTILGGPMAVLETGLKQRWLAIVFCACAIPAAFCTGNLAPSYTAITIVNNALAIDPWVPGACITILIAVIVTGGLKSVINVSKKTVPALMLLYVAGCFVALFCNGLYLLPAFKLIAAGAFSGKAVAGGFAGAGMIAAMRHGAGHGSIANQAGFGSTPIIAAAARSDNPVRQALVSSTGAFWDTVVIGALTGLVLVTGGIKNPSGLAGLSVFDMAATIFGRVPSVGPILFTGGMIAFVLSAIISWSYFGERAIEYLFKKKAIPLFRYCWILAVLFGALLKPASSSIFSHLILECSTLFFALMAAPNLVSLFFLNKVVVDETKKYLWSGPGSIDKSKDS
jgi:AGCS family alanine or glycine:cation symporter